MNKLGRKQISEIVNKLENIKSDLEFMQEDEESKFDAMPEGIQESEKGDAIQDAIDSISSAVDSIEEAIDSLNEI